MVSLEKGGPVMGAQTQAIYHELPIFPIRIAGNNSNSNSFISGDRDIGCFHFLLYLPFLLSLLPATAFRFASSRPFCWSGRKVLLPRTSQNLKTTVVKSRALSDSLQACVLGEGVARFWCSQFSHNTSSGLAAYSNFNFNLLLLLPCCTFALYCNEIKHKPFPTVKKGTIMTTFWGKKMEGE